jgi:surface antigen
MDRAVRAIILVSALALAGCERFSATSSGPQLASAPAAQTQSTASALSATDILDFVEPAAAGQLTAKDRAEATSAQYYALQFGRPRAPRAWQGDSGPSGRVSVGPYVRVNNLDCRNFSHLVTVGAKSYEHNGTACREADGSWGVVDS